CDAPPGEGEIHHSLWWYAHGGDTAVSNGVLLCWAHHDYVHQHTVSISALTGGGWQFRRSDGGVIASSHPPGTAGPTCVPQHARCVTVAQSDSLNCMRTIESRCARP